MRVEKIVSTEGIIEIRINGKGIAYQAARESVSRELTGLTCWAHYIFTEGQQMELFFGDFYTEITFCTTLKQTLCVVEYTKRLQQRIVVVKQWIRECKATEGTCEIAEKEEVL